MERRLTAILAADVVGYSRLMGANESGTVAALETLRSDFINPKIGEHQGRIVKLTGDGMLVEFPSVVNAVACAAEVQRGVRDRSKGVAPDRRIEFRIGVNVGDVIVQGEDILGDGVNVAARLESIATPGGITISGPARDHLGNRLDLTFEDIGEQTLKNIERPVRVYRVILDRAAAEAKGSPDGAQQLEKPSIAVLPFNNMSGDPEQEYFSDGITEDIITDLSNISGLFVVARNTAFTYKGKPIKVQQVAQELGVRFILEGSVRKAGSRVRVTGQLINGKDGGHVWAGRFDRDLTDIFAIQDEITRAKALALESGLAEAHASRGLALSLGERYDEADTEFEEAIAIDHNSFEGHYFYARSCFKQGRLEEAARNFERCAEIDPDDYQSPALSIQIYRSLDRTAEMQAAARRAVERAESGLARQPENPRPAYLGAAALITLGDKDRAREWLARALATDPDDIWTQYNVACVYTALGDTDRAFDLLERILPHAGHELKHGWIKHDSDLDPLRTHPRYQKILELVDR